MSFGVCHILAGVSVLLAGICQLWVGRLVACNSQTGASGWPAAWGMQGSIASAKHKVFVSPTWRVFDLNKMLLIWNSGVLWQFKQPNQGAQQGHPAQNNGTNISMKTDQQTLPSFNNNPFNSFFPSQLLRSTPTYATVVTLDLWLTKSPSSQLPAWLVSLSTVLWCQLHRFSSPWDQRFSGSRGCTAFRPPCGTSCTMTLTVSAHDAILPKLQAVYIDRCFLA